MTDRIILSERDTGQILKLLENPPKPTAALLAAARRRSGHGGIGAVADGQQHHGALLDNRRQ